MKGGAAGLLAIALSWPSFALAQPADDGVELVLWHSYSGTERVALLRVLDAFAATEPGFRVTPVSLAPEDLGRRFEAAADRGGGPDLLIYEHRPVGAWAAKDRLEPIELFVNETLLDELLRPCVLALAYGGSLYGLPLAYDVPALYVRTDRIPEPPRTLDAFLRAALANSDASAGKYALVYPLLDPRAHSAIFRALGGGSLYEGRRDELGVVGRPDVNVEAMVASLALIRGWVRDTRIVFADATAADAVKMFSDGRAAMVIAGPRFRRQIDPDVSYAVAHVPPLSSEPAAAGDALCEAIMMNAHSEHVDEAFQLMRFLAIDPRSTLTRRGVGGQSVTWMRGVASSEALSAREEGALSVFETVMRSAQPAPFDPLRGIVDQSVSDMIRDVIRNSVQPARAAKEAQARIEQARAPSP